MKQILVVEDDLAMSRGIVLALRNEGFSLTEAHNLREAEQLRQEHDDAEEVRPLDSIK